MYRSCDEVLTLSLWKVVDAIKGNDLLKARFVREYWPFSQLKEISIVYRSYDEVLILSSSSISDLKEMAFSKRVLSKKTELLSHS